MEVTSLVVCFLFRLPFLSSLIVNERFVVKKRGKGKKKEITDVAGNGNDSDDGHDGEFLKIDKKAGGETCQGRTEERVWRCCMVQYNIVIRESLLYNIYFG